MPIKVLSPRRVVKKSLTTELKTKLEFRQTGDELRMNKMETAWYEVLKSRNYDWLAREPMGLKLANNCRYHPDFIVIHEGRLIAFETKGFMRDDAQVKLKVAARMYPFIRFVLVTKSKKEWIETEVSP